MFSHIPGWLNAMLSDAEPHQAEVLIVHFVLAVVAAGQLGAGGICSAIFRAG